MPTNEELAAMGPGAVRQLIDTLQKRAEAAEKRLELRELACDEAIAEERRRYEAALMQAASILVLARPQADEPS